jgi:hypothetical protein
MFVLAIFGVVEFLRVFFTGFAYEDEVITGWVRAVFVVAGFAFAVDALANYLGMVTKVHAHTAVKHIEISLPQPVIAIRFAVFYNAAVYLVNVLEAALFHHGAQ